MYRLVHYLPTEYDRYAEALAVVGKDAMIWGGSVLAMHNLAMVNPEKIEVATTRRVRRELPPWISLTRVRDETPYNFLNGILCQPLADAFRHCKGKVMTYRLAEAV